MQRNKAFTLIELLIVILIIGILAAILIVALTKRIPIQQIKTTNERLKLIAFGLKNFEKQFPIRKNVVTGSGRGIPRPREFEGVVIGGVDISDMTGGEFLRLMLHPYENELEELKHFGINRVVMDWNEIKEMLNKKTAYDPSDEREIPEKMVFVDAWNKPLYYKFPGLNHSDKGLNPLIHKNARNVLGKNHSTGIPDIWSAGPNGINDEGNWSSTVNDPFEESDENDDICNWFENIE